jgi:hypothetical protein
LVTDFEELREKLEAEIGNIIMVGNIIEPSTDSFKA